VSVHADEVTRQLRSRPGRSLLAATYALCLLLGAATVVVLRPAATAPVEPLTDAQSVEQVVGAARQIVGLAGLAAPSGGYAFVSCADDDRPPYQAAVHVDFRLPGNNAPRVLRQEADALTAAGWTVAPSADEHFGHKLTAGAVTAVLFRNADRRDFGTLRVYGECRNLGDHRFDDPAWTDITGRLG
jgi:hypothetical protein